LQRKKVLSIFSNDYSTRSRRDKNCAGCKSIREKESVLANAWSNCENCFQKLNLSEGLVFNKEKK